MGHCDCSSREVHKSVKVTQQSKSIGILWDYLDKKKLIEVTLVSQFLKKVLVSASTHCIPCFLVK